MTTKTTTMKTKTMKTKTMKTKTLKKKLRRKEQKENDNSNAFWLLDCFLLFFEGGHFVVVADVGPGIGDGILLRSVCPISQIPWPFKLSQKLGPGGLVSIRDAFAVRLAFNNYMLRLYSRGHVCHLTMLGVRGHWAGEDF